MPPDRRRRRGAGPGLRLPFPYGRRAIRSHRPWRSNRASLGADPGPRQRDRGAVRQGPGSRGFPRARAACRNRAYANNYLIDTDHGVIVDIEATRAIRQAEVGAARTMLERPEMRFGMGPASLAAASADGAAGGLGGV